MPAIDWAFSSSRRRDAGFGTANGGERDGTLEMTGAGTIAVVGASGQVAKALARAARCTGVDLVAGGRAEVDLCEPVGLMGFLLKTRPRLVVNAAAYTAVDKAESEPELAHRVNAEGAGHLARICALQDLPLVHLSTDYVFDGANTAPYVETDLPAPLNAYGSSKLAGEQAVRSALQRHVIIRTAWLYGPDGTNFVKTMLRLGSQRDELRVIDDQIGQPTSAHDLATAILTIAERLVEPAANDIWGTYHLTGSGSTTWHGFAAETFRLAKAFGAQTPHLVAIPTSKFPLPARRPLHSVLATGKLAKRFGIRLPHWRESLGREFATIIAATNCVAHGEAA